MSNFWDVWQVKLAENVAREPEEYMLARGETAQEYAARVRAKMARTGVAGCNWSSPTFRATAKHFGVKFTRGALIAAEAAHGGRDQVQS